MTPRARLALIVGSVVAAGTLAALAGSGPATTGPVTSAPGVRVEFVDLAHSAFPSNPGPHAAVLIPDALPTFGPIRVWVYYHGHTNCVRNVVADNNGPCGSAGVRNSSHLAAQLSRSGSGAVVIVPAVRIGQPTGDAGNLSRSGEFAAMVTESLAKVGLADRAVSRVDIMGHSGGYVGMASALARGGADIRGVVLLDALYGNVSTFSSWLANHANAVSTGSDGYRFASITTGGSTLTNTQAVDRATRSLLGGKVADSLDLAKPVIFTRTSMSHTDTSRRLPEMFWRYW